MAVTEDYYKNNVKKIKKVRKQFELDEQLQEALSSTREILKMFKSKFPKEDDYGLWFTDKSEIKGYDQYLLKLIDFITFLQELHKEVKDDLDLDDSIDIGAFNERAKKMMLILKYVHDGTVPSKEYERLGWEDKIRSFAILPKNWDGEDAQEIPKSRIMASIEFLQNFETYIPNLKMVYPSWIGSVGLIYEIDKYKINVLFLSKEKVEISVIEPDSTLKSQKEYDVNSIKSFEPFLA